MRSLVSTRAGENQFGELWTGAGMNFAHKAAIPVLIATLAALLAPFLFLLVMELPESGIWTVATFVVVVVMLCFLTHWEANRPR